MATRVVNETKGTELASSAGQARRPWQRMRGLLGRGSLADDEALILPSAWAIHTWFMRFTIDVVFLDRAGVVLKTVAALPPFRFAAARGARWCIELPPGTVMRTATERGDRVGFTQ